MKKQDIGILGSGVVAQTLASGFLSKGNRVMIGTRDQSKLSDWKSQSGENAFTGSFEESAKFGETLILAVKGTAAKKVVTDLPNELISGKIIIDATNPIDDTPPVNGVLNFFTSQNRSLLEELQEAVPTANFVKAFNSVGSQFMVNPDFGKQKPTMFICGNNNIAKETVKDILDTFGWETEDMGKMESARAIESLCILWCIPGFTKNKWTHAFKLLKK